MDDVKIYLLLSSAAIVLRFGKWRPNISCGKEFQTLDNFSFFENVHRRNVLLFFSGYCNFQNGNCGLKRDKDAAFHWTVGSGQTLTESTGPSYDHTSFRKDGKKTKER